MTVGISLSPLLSVCLLCHLSVSSAVHLSVLCCQPVCSAVYLSPLLSVFSSVVSLSSAVCLSPLLSGCLICCSPVSCAICLLLQSFRKVLWTVYPGSSVCSFQHHIYLVDHIHTWLHLHTCHSTPVSLDTTSFCCHDIAMFECMVKNKPNLKYGKSDDHPVYT